MKDTQDKASNDVNEKITTESRRSFLKKAGVIALYTPPAITMLMQPTQASIMKSPGGQNNRHHGFRRGNNPH